METASEISSSSTPKALPSIDFDSLSPVEQKKWVLDTFGKEFCDGDREATKAYVRENWRIMKYATEELRNDEDILMHALVQDGNALHFVTKESLKDDWRIGLVAVCTNGWILEILSEKLRDMDEIVKSAVEQTAGSYEFASKRLRADRSLALNAVTSYGKVLEFVSDESLQDDDEVVLAAVTSYGPALEYASNRLQDDKNIVQSAVASFPGALMFASEKLRDDKDVFSEDFIPSYIPWLWPDAAICFRATQSRQGYSHDGSHSLW